MQPLWWAKLRALLSRRSPVADLDAELDAEFQLRLDDYLQQGLPPDEAKRLARRALGNRDVVLERSRDTWRFLTLDTFIQDVQHGARLWARAPGFTAVAVLTLALGIGAVTVIYSVIQNVLLDPFPYTDSNRLVDVIVYDTTSRETFKGEPMWFRGPLPIPEFLDYQEQNHVFEDVAGTESESAVVMLRDGAERVRIVWVTPNAFTFLGVRPILGRGLIEQDGEPAAPHVAVLGHKAWQQYFGSSPAVVGQTLNVNGDLRTIVGVMPPRFTWHVGDVWIPSPLRRSDAHAADVSRWFQAHLKPGVSVAEAEAELNVIARRRAREHPEEYPEHWRIGVIKVIDFVVGRFRGVLYTLCAAVALLLLIACCNVANMLLARATVRAREMALRAALGASRTRLLRQLMIESLMLALAGAAAGCLLAYGGIKALTYVIPEQTVPYETEFVLDGRVLTACLATSVLAAMLFGLLPAWYGARRDLVRELKDAARGLGAGLQQSWTRNGLIVAEVAVSLVLLLGAGLLMRTFLMLVTTDLGFEPRTLIQARVNFPSGAYQTAPERDAYFRRAVEQVGALPGVVAAGEAAGGPMGGIDTDLQRPGEVATGSSKGLVILCDANYLHVIGATLQSGRLLSSADVSGARRVAVVSEALVAQYFRTENPLGRPIRIGQLAKVNESIGDPTFEIIGVVRDMKNQGVREGAAPAAYVPTTAAGVPWRTIFARTAGDPQLLLKDVRRTLRAVDRSVAVRGVSSLADELRAGEYAQPQFGLIVLGAFAGAGLLLVAIGVYGVMAYTVSRRTQEFAIRMALGADRQAVLRDVFRTGGTLTALGILLGLGISVASNRLIANPLWDIPAFDPLTTAAAVAIIILMGALACMVPAFRAASVEPMAALRHE